MSDAGERLLTNAAIALDAAAEIQKHYGLPPNQVQEEPVAEIIAKAISDGQDFVLAKEARRRK